MTALHFAARVGTCGRLPRHGKQALHTKQSGDGFLRRRRSTIDSLRLRTSDKRKRQLMMIRTKPVTAVFTCTALVTPAAYVTPRRQRLSRRDERRLTSAPIAARFERTRQHFQESENDIRESGAPSIGACIASRGARALR